MGRPNPRHGKGRGRLKRNYKEEKPIKQKTRSREELTVTPWFPEDEEKNKI